MGKFSNSFNELFSLSSAVLSLSTLLGVALMILFPKDLFCESSYSCNGAPFLLFSILLLEAIGLFFICGLLLLVSITTKKEYYFFKNHRKVFLLIGKLPLFVILGYIALIPIMILIDSLT